MRDSETALKERLKKIGSIIYTSVDDAKSSMFHIHDVDLLRDCFMAECDSYNRSSMLRNINSRINQIRKEQ